METGKGKTEAANERERGGLLLPTPAVAPALAAVEAGGLEELWNSLGWVMKIFFTRLKGCHEQQELLCPQSPSQGAKTMGQGHTGNNGTEWLRTPQTRVEPASPLTVVLNILFMFFGPQFLHLSSEGSCWQN